MDSVILLSPRPVSLAKEKDYRTSRFSECFAEGVVDAGAEKENTRSRTPSPTPAEQVYLDRKGVFDWRPLRTRSFWLRRDRVVYYIILAIVITGIALFAHYQRKLIHVLKPAAQTLRGLPAGWLIPIGLFLVLSFPPLFGHEIVGILCGLVWGLGKGFAIVAAGTFIGELGNFYAFKYCCRSRAGKLERNTVPYACFVKIVRDGGFKIALISRYSLIPGHLTTAVYSTSGLGMGVFCAAAALSLPKQFALVFIGVLVENTDDDVSTKLKSVGIIGVTVVITGMAFWYILREMNKVKDVVIHERRKARRRYCTSAHEQPAKDTITEVERVEDVSTRLSDQA